MHNKNTMQTDIVDIYKEFIQMLVYAGPKNSLG